MNSCTFSSEAHRKYAIRLTVFVLLPAFGLFLLGIFLEPLSGDLTRIGGYAEREFGWKQPQSRFSKVYYTKNHYIRHHDVVVLGDSFANAWPMYQWQNHFIAATGTSVVTLNINKTRIENVLVNTVFQETPPKLFILSSSERGLVDRLEVKQPCDPSTTLKRSAAISSSSIAVGKPNILPEQIRRDTAWSEVKLGFVARYLEKNAMRLVTGSEPTEVRKIALKAPAPFSSVNKQELLVYKDEISKISDWQEAGIDGMTCRLERIRSRIEANGKTQFILLVAPDKLTAYSEYISDQKLRDGSLLSRLAEQNSATVPRTDLSIKEAIHAGKLDVYLPDDTHWGSNGQKIVSDTLLDFLQAGK